jgi:hypothetical protein
MTMLKVTQNNFNALRVADTALNASRQIWLAGLGAAVVTRQWATNDAGQMLRSLIKEGASVEGRARRIIGKQIDNSVALATGAWNSARHTAITTVNGLVDAASSALPKFRPSKAAKSKPVAAKAKRRSPALGSRTRKTRVAGRSRKV